MTERTEAVDRTEAADGAGAPDRAGVPAGVGAPDRIEVLGLRAVGHHGVFASERRDGQEFVVDLVLHVDTRRAAASDDLADTVDYGVLSQRVHDIVTGDPVDLIETLAARIADAVLADVRVDAVDVAVHKPQAPVPVPFGDVVLRIHRRQAGA